MFFFFCVVSFFPCFYFHFYFFRFFALSRYCTFFFVTEVNPASVEFQDYCPSVLLTLKDGWRKARSSRPGAIHHGHHREGLRFANRLMSKALLLKSAWQNTSIIGSLTCSWLLLLDFPLAAKNHGHRNGISQLALLNLWLLQISQIVVIFPTFVR